MIEGTITGPCPYGIVVAPVNYPLEFECSFGGDIIFYWVIDATNGSWSDQVIFIKNDGQSDKCWHSVCLRAEFYSTNGVASTKLYVMGTSTELPVNITCGVTAPKTVNSPLEENGTSHSPVELTFFDSPTYLQHKFFGSVLLLSWSQLPLLPQYTCMYEVTLRNRMNESQVLQLNANQTNISISHEQVPSYHDACAFYSWSLVAIVEDKRSPTAQYSKDVSIPSNAVDTCNEIFPSSIDSYKPDIAMVHHSQTIASDTFSSALVSDNPSPFEENDKTPSTKIVLIIVPSFVLVIALCGGVLCVAILYFYWKSRSTTGADCAVVKNPVELSESSTGSVNDEGDGYVDDLNERGSDLVNDQSTIGACPCEQPSKQSTKDVSYPIEIHQVLPVSNGSKPKEIEFVMTGYINDEKDSGFISSTQTVKDEDSEGRHGDMDDDEKDNVPPPSTSANGDVEGRQA